MPAAEDPSNEGGAVGNPSVSRALVLIGYWRSDYDLNWPQVEDFIDEDWDLRARRDTVTYLRRASVARIFWGSSTCRICGVDNGSAELTDGRFIWPEGFAHYVEAHGVRPPDLFVDHVLAHRARPLSVAIDDVWWRRLRTGPNRRV
jgi:hypothetical protein